MTDEMDNSAVAGGASIERLLQSYQVVLDIFSLAGISQGYPVNCRDWTFKEFKDMILKGIFAALIGDFKVGKTFLTGKLLDLDVPASQVLHTPGICVATKSLENKPVAPVKPAPTQRGATFLSKRDNVSSTNPPVPSAGSNSNSKVKDFEYILLDTAGTDMPANMNSLKDTRATEVFLRSLILSLSDRVIFVTNKFDRPTQEKLVNLTMQLKKWRKQVTSLKRILLVHNMSDVLRRDVLEQRITVVRDCYNAGTGPALTSFDDVDEEHKEDTEVTWAERHYSGVDVYDTNLVTHFFLVNDDAPDTDGFKPKEYNKKVIDVLKSKLYETNKVQQCMMANIVRFCNEQLNYFLTDWSQPSNCMIVVEDPDNPKSGAIAPYAFKNPPNEILDRDYYMKLDIEDSTSGELVAKDYWPLTRMKFVDSGVMSETVQELQGTWFINRKTNKFLVYIRAPGFSANMRSRENIRFMWDRVENWAEVHVKLLPPKPGEGFELGGSAPQIRGARGVYRCNFPDADRYLLPTNEKFYEEDVQVQDGEIWVTLNLEVDFLK